MIRALQMETFEKLDQKYLVDILSAVDNFTDPGEGEACSLRHLRIRELMILKVGEPGPDNRCQLLKELKSSFFSFRVIFIVFPCFFGHIYTTGGGDFKAYLQICPFLVL